MPISRSSTVASLNTAGRPLRSVHHSLCVSPRKSNFLWARPCVYLLALIFFCLFFIVPAIAGVGKVVYWSPYVTKTTINSATINWHGPSNAEGGKAGEIEYATTSYYNAHGHFDKTAESRTTGAYQHTQLTSLEPDTSYTYLVKPSAGPTVFSARTFRTMPVSGPFTFIVISDTHAQEGRFIHVAKAIVDNETDVLFILDGGDYTGHDSDDQWPQYFEAADVMLSKFAIFNTIGNHEYHNSTADAPALHYHGTFDILPSGALNYSFDCAGIRFVILASPDPLTALPGGDPQTSLALAQSQAPWLRDQLDNNMLGTFTIHHHPIWDFNRTTLNSNLQSWEDLYHAYPISATFSGHTHDYQRYSVMGIPYFVVGNAGGAFSDLTPPPYAVWWITGETRQLGYLRVTVDPANNTATATEIFIASVDDTVVPETITLYPAPITYDTITFQLKPTGGSRSGN
jgi:acid phosphatase type 7